MKQNNLEKFRFKSILQFLANCFLTLLLLASCGKPKGASITTVNNTNLNEQLKEGFLEVSERDYKDSIKRSDKIIEFKDNIPEAYFNRGMAKVNNNQLADGLEDLKKSQQLFKNQNNEIGYKMVTRAVENYSPSKKTPEKPSKKEI